MTYFPKSIRVSDETHSQLFSLKNKMILQANKKLKYNDVINQLINEHDILIDDIEDSDRQAEMDKAFSGMHQLEEKQWVE